MSTDGPQAPAGWYVNENGEMKWWDGTQFHTVKPYVAPGPEPNKAPKQKSSGFVGFVLGTAIVVVAVVAIGFALDTPEARQKQQLRDAPVLAQIACERAIKDMLKSPSSAVFEGTAAKRVEQTEKYVVVGNVDAENSFGAMMRNSFLCEVVVANDSAQVFDAQLM